MQNLIFSQPLRKPRKNSLAILGMIRRKADSDRLICVHDKLCKRDFPHTDAVKAVLHPFNFVNRDEQQTAPIPANDETLHQMYFALPNFINGVGCSIFFI